MTKTTGHIVNLAKSPKKTIDNAELSIQTCDSHANEMSRKEIKSYINKIREDKKEKLTLDKSKYDIHFVINLIKTLIDQIERNKFNSSDIAFTLSYSLKKLLANLEVERDQ
jgi:LytS/YehU family sensor histidine kinase